MSESRDGLFSLPFHPHQRHVHLVRVGIVLVVNTN